MTINFPSTPTDATIYTDPVTDISYRYSAITNSWTVVSGTGTIPVVGVQGPQGPQGLTGAGVQGAQGFQGQQGPQGASGPPSSEPVILSDTTGITGSSRIFNAVKLSQIDYDDITTPDSGTLYIIV